MYNERERNLLVKKMTHMESIEVKMEILVRGILNHKSTIEYANTDGFRSTQQNTRAERE